VTPTATTTYLQSAKNIASVQPTAQMLAAAVADLLLSLQVPKPIIVAQASLHTDSFIALLRSSGVKPAHVRMGLGGYELILILYNIFYMHDVYSHPLYIYYACCRMCRQRLPCQHRLCVRPHYLSQLTGLISCIPVSPEGERRHVVCVVSSVDV